MSGLRTFYRIYSITSSAKWSLGWIFITVFYLTVSGLSFLFLSRAKVSIDIFQHPFLFWFLFFLVAAVAVAFFDMTAVAEEYGFKWRSALKEEFQRMTGNRKLVAEYVGSILLFIVISVCMWYGWGGLENSRAIWVIFVLPLLVGIFITCLVLLYPLRPFVVSNGDSLLRYCAHCINNSGTDEEGWKVKAFHALILAKEDYYKKTSFVLLSKN